MPYVAIDTDTRKRVDTYSSVRVEEDFPQEEFGGGRLICQFCGAPMHTRQGERYSPHFVHDAECDRAGYPSKPESAEHFAGKAFVREVLRKAHPNESVEVEVPIAGCKRIADVLVSFRDGWSIAHEIQFSSIAEPELIRRTRDYHRAGVDVMWWFGPEPPPTASGWARRRDQPLIGLKIEAATAGVSAGRTMLHVNPTYIPPAARPVLDAARIAKEIRYRWYPPRLRLLLTLLLWRGRPLTFHQLAKGTGLTLNQVGGAHGEVAKIVKLTYGSTDSAACQRVEKTVCLTPAACVDLGGWLADVPPGLGNPTGTVLGRLIGLARQKEKPPLVEESRARAKRLGDTGLPSPWPRRRDANR